MSSSFRSRSKQALWISQMKEEQIASYLENMTSDKVQNTSEQVSSTKEHWNHFYSTKKDGFFKNRYNLRYFFPELLPPQVQDHPELWHPPLNNGEKNTEPPDWKTLEGRTIILELGCGVGNSIFPLIRANPHLFIFGVDFSAQAIELLKSNPEYDSRRLYALVADVAKESEKILQIIPSHSVDYVTLFWTLSAQPPEHMVACISLIEKLLKPAVGMVLFRDYAFGDLAQIRQHPKNCIGKNLYRRGDGTLAYYFTESYLQSLFPSNRWQVKQLETCTKEIINHKENKKMTRRWLQAKFLFFSDEEK
eukprot:jgi/Galph1/6036/GphlegSOOS_G4705.1